MAFISALNNSIPKEVNTPLINVSDFPKTIKENILKYLLDRKYVVCASTKRVYDAISKSDVDRYCQVYYSDGEYEWNSSEIFYFEKYGLKLNDDFIERVLSQSNAQST